MKRQYALILTVLLSPASPALAQQEAEVDATEAVPSAVEDVLIQVAHLRYGEPLTSSQCFSTGYLHLLNRESTIRANPEPVTVDLSADDLYQYPFVVLSGEGDFSFTDEEIEALQHYLNSGGFILASSGCSNSNWNRAFQREIARFLPELAENSVQENEAADADEPVMVDGTTSLENDLARYGFIPLALDHPVFHSVFDITSFEMKKVETSTSDTKLYALKRNGRLAMVYSPEGLNDTGNAGGGCCCCGGNELRNAKYINANILAYILTGN